MKKNILLGFFLFTLTTSFSQNVTIYVVDRDDYDFSNITKTVTTQKEAETNYKTMVIVYDSFRKECIGGYGSYDDETLTKQELRKIVDNAVQDLYKGQVQIRTKNTSAQEKFKTLMTYDIKSISLDNKSVCPFNGFNHGTVDYGIYKQRGYYFAITYDNAVFGEGMTIFETVNFEYFDTLENKGMECTLKELNEMNRESYKGAFFETKKTGTTHLSITCPFEGKEYTMKFLLTPQTSK